jgi:phospholipid/cholesterol/gamma-HCH transport system ATP-binding protein
MCGMSPLSSDIVLSVRDLVVQFDDADGQRNTVLDGVTFDVYRGETLVIMGGSGCGKSTLLNALIGELEPDAGSIHYHLPQFGDIDLANADEESRNALRKRLGILFQSGALFSSLTLAENVALPLREHSHVGKDIIDIVVAMKLEQVHMLPHRDKYPSQLSGGQKKRAGLARATAMDPEILFYDEPSAGLDPVTSSAIDELIMDLSHKLSVTSIVVTHEMDSAFRIADRMIMLHLGKIMRIGPKSDFVALRDAQPDALANDDERLVHQFLTGSATGPLADMEGHTEYERILIGGRITPPR